MSQRPLSMPRLRLGVVGGPLAPLALAILILASPWLGNNAYWEREMVLIAIYTLVVSGLNLSFGYGGELALGQIAVMATGAYVTAILCQHGVHDILIALVASIGAAAIIGMLSGLPGLRVENFALALLSFFLLVLLPYIIQIFSAQTGGLVGIAGVIDPTLFGRVLGIRGLFLLAVAVTVSWLAVMRNMVLSDFGAALKNLRESRILVQSLGMSVKGLKIRAYVIGSLPAGAAGCLFAYLSGFISPGSFTFTITVGVLAASILGGSDSIYGAPVGAALLVLGPLQSAVFTTYSLVAYGAFLIIVGTVFAGGIAGLARARVQLVGRSAQRGAEEDGLPVRLDGAELKVSEMVKIFGGSRALDGASLVALPGQVTAIIGPNGAGKTTLLNTISGFVEPEQGRVMLGMQSLSGLRPSAVAKLGVGRTFQTPFIPKSASAFEVVQTARAAKWSVSLVSAVLRLPGFREGQRASEEAGMRALAFGGLTGVACKTARSLPLATRRLLEVCRAVAAEPRVVLLDEPAAGLDEDGLRDLSGFVRRIRDAGATVILVEHNVSFVMSVADMVHVMAVGRVIASGKPELIKADPRVIEAYLGRKRQPEAPAVRRQATGDAASEAGI
jgi:branched-chain amino acid transport system permease protein